MKKTTAIDFIQKYGKHADSLGFGKNKYISYKLLDYIFNDYALKAARTESWSIGFERGYLQAIQDIDNDIRKKLEINNTKKRKQPKKETTKWLHTYQKKNAQTTDATKNY